jgi:hypothetical protein
MKQMFIALTGLFLAAIIAHGQHSNLPREDFWVTDGEVRTVLETNGVVYIGGIFDYVGPVSETGGAFDSISGASLIGFPKFAGTIKVIQPDNAGGWFVGGQFNSVDGYTITNLAHILSDRTIDPNWAPNPNGAVLAMIMAQDFLYVGGSFNSIGGNNNACLAALDPATGTALAFHSEVTNSYATTSVNSLALAEGTLYLGGFFSYVNGQPREHLAAVDATSGDVKEWHPNGQTGAEFGTRIDALAIADKILYVGGTFNSIGNEVTDPIVRHFIAALDTRKNLDESVTSWNPEANGPVTSIAIACDIVYLGGAFTSINGKPRNHIAAVSIYDGTPTDWNPNADNDVLNLTLAGNTVYAGGKFAYIGGQERMFLAALDRSSGEATLWNPRADFGIAGIYASGSSVVAGGVLGPGGKLRQNAAAFSARTGRPLDWSPRVYGSTTLNMAAFQGLKTLSAGSNTIYMGGFFSSLNESNRSRLGSVDAITGVVKNWNPGSDGFIERLLVGRNIIYAGGFFSSVGGAMRTNLAALDLISGKALAGWDPHPDGKITSMAQAGGTLFAAGNFNKIGGRTRKHLAALDLLTGEPSRWNPEVNDQVSSISLQGTRLYMGGVFTAVGNQSIHRLAAVDTLTGEATCWRPEPEFKTGVNSGISAILISSNLVYAAGSFDFVGGKFRNSLAALTTDCPARATEWDPNIGGSVSAIAANAGTIYAVGKFRDVGGAYRPSLAVFPPVGAPRIVTQPQSQLVEKGIPVTLFGSAEGQLPLSYQWEKNGVAIPGANEASLSFRNPQASDSGDYTLVVTNRLGLVNSHPAILTVLELVNITSQPLGQSVNPGASVALSVGVTGSPPPIYQWRRNGVNIPGAIFPTLNISNAQPTDGGTYSVIVLGLRNALISSNAVVVVNAPALTFGDNLNSSVALSGESGIVSGNNLTATQEPFEPRHARKAGGKSVWVSWTPLESGVATFSTAGSSFDTLLGIYTGASMSDLTLVDADEDRGGYLTSQAVFNALAGTQYLIAVDGYAGQAGNIVLKWSLDKNISPFPRITRQPLSRSVTNGQAARFSVEALNATSYQWFFGCRALAGATNAQLVIPATGIENVGTYHVEARNLSTQPAESFEASLDIGPEARIVAQEKLEDLFNPDLTEADRLAAAKAVKAAASLPSGVLAVGLGSVASQTLATADQAASDVCDQVMIVAPKYLALYTTEAGIMQVDTIGSTIDTAMIIYTTNATYRIKHLLDCDNNGAPDHIRSQLIFRADKESFYLIFAGGVNGAAGTLKLNWKMDTLPGAVHPPGTWIITNDAAMTLSAEVINRTASPLHFQWRLNGATITGATNQTYFIPRASGRNAGFYEVIVQNFAGSITNAVGTVYVGTVPNPALKMLKGTDGRFYAHVSAPFSHSNIVQAATELLEPAEYIQWTSLWTNRVPAGAAINFPDLESPFYPQRFYRLAPWH